MKSTPSSRWKQQLKYKQQRKTIKPGSHIYKMDDILSITLNVFIDFSTLNIITRKPVHSGDPNLSHAKCFFVPN